MESWKINLYSLWSAQFIAMTGLAMVVPFLPLYLREIGMTDDSAVRIWSGIIYSASFFVSAIMQPLWGILGDRRGRKPMIVRALFALALSNFFMGFARTAPQLFLLRLLQGGFSGFVAPSLALTASCTPQERMGQALGTLQSATVTGMIMGPFLGGLLAHVMGYRPIFFGTAFSCFLGMLIVFKFVKEDSKCPAQAKRSRLRDNLSFVFGSPTLRVMILLLILVQVAIQIVTPFLSLYVEYLHVAPEYVGLMAGVVFGITGITNALTAPYWGRRGDRSGPLKNLPVSMIGMTAAYIPQAFVSNAYQLLGLRALLGVFVAGVVPTVNTIVQRHTPEDRRGGIYGIFQSGLLLGNVIGPLAGGFLAAFLGLRIILLITGALIALGYLGLTKRMRDMNLGAAK